MCLFRLIRVRKRNNKGIVKCFGAEIIYFWLRITKAGSPPCTGITIVLLKISLGSVASFTSTVDSSSVAEPEKFGRSWFEGPDLQ